MTLRMLVRLACLTCAVATLAGCVVYETSGPTTRPVPPPPVPRAVVSVDLGFFYDTLDPDGDWLWIAPHGWVWIPNSVDPFWRPYTVGHWEWTDWGWTWVSAERWGWATYHYGRWVRVGHRGWAWVPGDVWGPAWVAWRHGPGVVGWAPLPPEARFRAGVGLDWGGLDIDVVLGLDSWCFLDDVRFADADVHRHAYPVGRNATVIRTTASVTRVRVVDQRIVNEGIDRAEIERRTHRPIPLRRIVDNPRADRHSAEIAPSEVRVFRPAVRPGSSDAAPRRGRKPAEPAPSAAPDPGVESRAERRWDNRWSQDWRKLETVQRRDEPAGSKPGTRPAPQVMDKQREENYEASQNAYRELVAERERAQRQAERATPKAGAPKGGASKPGAEATRGGKKKGKDKKDKD